MAVISLTDINVTFKQKNREIVAVQNESITIEKGDIYGIVGYSGAGKSTLVRTINLLQRPTSGSVLVNGTEMTSLKPAQLRDERKKIGMIFQHFNLMSELTVFGNVAQPLKHAKMSKADKAKKVNDLLDLVGLADRAGNYPAQLSGGQKQRLSIARALVKDAEIVILDEATAALDNESEKIIQHALDNLMTHKTTIVIAHRLSTVHNADQIVVLNEGEIVERGSHDELLAQNGVYKTLYDAQFE